MMLVFLSYYAVKKMIARREQERFSLDTSDPGPSSLTPSRRTTWSRSGGPLSRGAQALSRLFSFGARGNTGSGHGNADLELGLRRHSSSREPPNRNRDRPRPAQAIARLASLGAPGGVADGGGPLGTALLRAVTGEATRARSDSEGTAGSGGGRGRGRSKGARSGGPSSGAMVCEEEDPRGEGAAGGQAEVGRVEDEARRERSGGGEENPSLAGASAVGGMLSVPSVNRQLLTSSNT
jgi:hypothetical protein